MKMNSNLWMASTALMLSLAAPAFAQEADVPVEEVEATSAGETITVIGSAQKIWRQRDKPIWANRFSSRPRRSTRQNTA
jgi:hypothetical protein